VTDTSVFQLAQPGTFADPLTEALRTAHERCWFAGSGRRGRADSAIAQTFAARPSRRERILTLIVAPQAVIDAQIIR
jgi:hypothetical protein